MPKPQFNDRKEALSGFELEKVLYDVSERLSSQILSRNSSERGLTLTIDVWELENLLLSALNAAINEIRIFDETKAEDFSFELKRRRNTLVHDLVNLLIECLRDAYREDIAVEYTATKVVSVKFLKKNPNLSVVKKEFANRVHEVLRHLLGK